MPLMNTFMYKVLKLADKERQLADLTKQGSSARPNVYPSAWSGTKSPMSLPEFTGLYAGVSPCQLVFLAYSEEK